jgi:NADPH:quinone reductase-like Zn-dependent oxidoreductase
MSSLPSTQQAVYLTGKRAPLIQDTAPVVAPAAGEIAIKVSWTCSSPLELHVADGGLMVDKYPFRTGCNGVAGTVAAVGPGGDLKGLAVGDSVISWAWRGGKEANHQEYVTVPAYLAGKTPSSIGPEAAVGVPANVATVFHTAVANLGLQLPWPVPEGWRPDAAGAPILIWGASSSVGIYALQILRHWGYVNLVAVASARHHAYLTGLGAVACFDYRRQDAVEAVRDYAQGWAGAGRGPLYPYIIDCIGSLDSTLRPLTKIAQSGSRVAVMMPVIVRAATDDAEPEYLADVNEALPGQWADGMLLLGVRTHFHLQVRISPSSFFYRCY